MPTVPSTGPLGLIVICGTIALLAYAVAAAVERARRRWPRAAWCGAVVGLAAAAILLGVVGSPLHGPSIVLTLLAAGRNAVFIEGVARVATIIGMVCWAVSGVAAAVLFGF